MDQAARPNYVLLKKENNFKYKSINWLKIKWWKNIYHANTNQKKVGEAILILVKIDLTENNITMYKEGYFIFRKRSLIQETEKSYLLKEFQNTQSKNW